MDGSGVIYRFQDLLQLNKFRKVSKMFQDFRHCFEITRFLFENFYIIYYIYYNIFTQQFFLTYAIKSIVYSLVQVPSNTINASTCG